MSILVTQSPMSPIEEYIEEIKPMLESHWLTNMGPVYKKFQQGLKDYLGVPKISLFVNAYLAIRVGLTGRKAVLKLHAG